MIQSVKKFFDTFSSRVLKYFIFGSNFPNEFSTNLIETCVLLFHSDYNDTLITDSISSSKERVKSLVHNNNNVSVVGIGIRYIWPGKLLGLEALSTDIIQYRA